MAVFKDEKKTKDGRQYYYKVYKKDFEGNNKAYKSKRYKSPKEAEEAERLFLMKRDNPIHKEFSLIAIDYIEYCYDVKKESTAYSIESYYNNHIKDFFKKDYIDGINIPRIKDWQSYMLNKKLSIRTLNKAYCVLKSIFDHAIKNFGLSTNFVSLLGPFQEKRESVIKDDEKLRYITHEQFLQFVDNIGDLTWKTFFIFLYYTGMRKGEVQALNWHDIDFINKQITVNKTLSVKIRKNSQDNYKITSTKNCKNRKITMSKMLIDQLLLYKSEVMKYTDFNENWFVFGNSRFLAQTSIDRKKDFYFKLSNIKPITIHEFRHSHVSLLINEYINTSRTKNMKIDTAKFFLMMSERMGHTVEVMQRTYLHLFPTIQDEIVDLLDNL